MALIKKRFISRPTDATDRAGRVGVAFDVVDGEARDATTRTRGRECARFAKALYYNITLSSNGPKQWCYRAPKVTLKNVPMAGYAVFKYASSSSAAADDLHTNCTHPSPCDPTPLPP